MAHYVLSVKERSSLFHISETKIFHSTPAVMNSRRRDSNGSLYCISYSRSIQDCVCDAPCAPLHTSITCTICRGLLKKATHQQNLNHSGKFNRVWMSHTSLTWLAINNSFGVCKNKWLSKRTHIAASVKILDRN